MVTDAFTHMTQHSNKVRVFLITLFTNSFNVISLILIRVWLLNAQILYTQNLSWNDTNCILRCKFCYVEHHQFCVESHEKDMEHSFAVQR